MPDRIFDGFSHSKALRTFCTLLLHARELASPLNVRHAITLLAQCGRLSLGGWVGVLAPAKHLSLVAVAAAAANTNPYESTYLTAQTEWSPLYIYSWSAILERGGKARELEIDLRRAVLAPPPPFLLLENRTLLCNMWLASVGKSTRLEGINHVKRLNSVIEEKINGHLAHALQLSQTDQPALADAAADTSF